MPSPKSQPVNASVDLCLDELKEWRRERTHRLLNPASVRAIVLALLQGGNFRKYSEKYVAELTTIYASWLMQVVLQAKAKHGGKWRQELLKAAKAAKGPDSLNLRAWVMTATSKTVVNLAGDEGDEKYLDSLVAENIERVKTHRWGSHPMLLAGVRRNATSVSFDLDESTWFLRMVGSSAVAIRGAVKSTFGKRLERAFLKTCFNMLGMTEGTHYRLNSRPSGQPGKRKGRERDAIIVLDPHRRKEIILEMGLIGSGNPEIVNDKIKRVSGGPVSGGIVIYDKLPTNTTARENARKLKVELIGLREPRDQSPVHELAKYLRSRASYRIRPVPKAALFAAIVTKMGDADFRLPTDVVPTAEVDVEALTNGLEAKED